MKRRGRTASRGWLRRQLARRPLPVWVLVATDLLIFTAALLVFALFHHVLPRREQAAGLVSKRVATTEASTPAPEAAEAQAFETAAAEATPTATAQADPVGYFGTVFADKFSAGDVLRTENSYQSANLSLTLTAYDEKGVQFYVADFYIRDISCLQTGFAKETYGRGYSEWPSETAARMGAVLAINGDYYGGRSDGVVIRNGTLYREDDNPKRDLCALYWDGTMETFSPADFDSAAELERGAYQVWNFGPMLLDENGQPMSSFNSDVNPRNPRTAIGYYEPGHYCFVVVDGRSSSSKGLSLENMSKLMYMLGCKRAYNLDGGQTSQMVYADEVVNHPYNGGRKCSDVIAIVDM